MSLRPQPPVVPHATPNLPASRRAVPRRPMRLSAGFVWGGLRAGLLAAAACDRAATTAPAAAVADALPSASRGLDAGESGLPARYVLPGDAVFPEASAYDERTGALYVSSATTGAVLRGDVRDSALAPFLAAGADGRTSTTGLAVDPFRGRLFVAGGASGRVWVYDSRSGALLAGLTAATGAAFVNDVAVAPDGAAYFTDSQNPVLYRVAGDGGRGFRVEPWFDLANTVVHFRPGPNLNGIVATSDGRYLFVVQTNTGQLYRVDVGARTVAEVDLGGERLTGGDGLFLRGATLYAAQNQAGAIAEVRLQASGSGAPRGRVVAHLTDPTLQFPTAVREVRGRLLVVNSQLDRLQAGQAPTTPFTLSVLRRPGAGGGVADTAPAVPARSPREQQVFDLLRSIETGDAAARAVVAPNLIQHNFDLADGAAAFGAFLGSIPPGTARARPARVVQDGEYVFAQTDYNLFGPKVGFDIFRFDDGRIVEHWDNLQTAAGPSPSGHTMTDGATEVHDLHKTTANKALVLAFVDEVLIQGRTDNLDRFFANGQYIQHNAAIGDGVAAFKAFFQALAARGLAVQDGHVRAVLGRGNFVLAVHDGSPGGRQATAFYDLFRVEDGKIAEHWDVLQAIPPRDQWKNANGKFGFDARLARP